MVTSGNFGMINFKLIAEIADLTSTPPVFYYGVYVATVSFEELEKAIDSLVLALDFATSRKKETEIKIARDACIQRFEFCIELAWKFSAKKMGSSYTTSKIVIREMAQNKLIDNPEKWMEFIEARNKSSHTYDDKIAQEVFGILPIFLVEGQKLLNILKIK